MEKWLPVKGFEGLYEVSNLGRVRSLRARIFVPASRRNAAHYRTRAGKILKARTANGYLDVCLYSVDSEPTDKRVHELVLTAFVGPRPDGAQACHGGGNKANCELGNLRWDTPKANNADKVRHGTQPRGVSIAWAKLSESDVLKIRAAAGFVTQRELAARFGVAQGHISRIVNHQEWRHL